jgi:hypothetical protein
MANSFTERKRANSVNTPAGNCRAGGLASGIKLPSRAGEFYGSIRSALAAVAGTIGNNDSWIAAVRAAGLILVLRFKHLIQFRSWPGLFRPSTPSAKASRSLVDVRQKSLSSGRAKSADPWAGIS